MRCSRLIRGHRRHVRFGRAIFQILIQERPQYFTPKMEPGVAAEFQRAERAAVSDFLAVKPRAQHQKNLVVARCPSA